MNPLLRSLIKWLYSIIGQKLAGVIALIHVYDEHEDNESPQAIYLKFENDLGGNLECASDGESILYSPKLPAETDLGEYGKEILKDISNTELWCECVGSSLVSSFVLFANGNVSIGVRLIFQSGKSIDIVNLGDEIYIYNFLPRHIVEEENITFDKVSSEMLEI